MEFYLLRRAITARIGRTALPGGMLPRLWAAGLLAGGAGWLVMLAPVHGHAMLRGMAALAAFAIVYGAATLALGVAEARALSRRILRR